MNRRGIYEMSYAVDLLQATYIRFIVAIDVVSVGFFQHTLEYSDLAVDLIS